MKKTRSFKCHHQNRAPESSAFCSQPTSWSLRHGCHFHQLMSCRAIPSWTLRTPLPTLQKRVCLHLVQHQLSARVQLMQHQESPFKGQEMCWNQTKPDCAKVTQRPVHLDECHAHCACNKAAAAPLTPVAASRFGQDVAPPPLFFSSTCPSSPSCLRSGQKHCQCSKFMMAKCEPCCRCLYHETRFHEPAWSISCSGLSMAAMADQLVATGVHWQVTVKGVLPVTNGPNCCSPSLCSILLHWPCVSGVLLPGPFPSTSLMAEKGTPFPFVSWTN